MEEKSDDDEIPNYITVLNTVIASQGISSNPEVIIKIAFTSQNKSIVQSENHKIFYVAVHFKNCCTTPKVSFQRSLRLRNP